MSGKINRFIALQQQSMVCMATYYNNLILETNESIKINIELSKNVTRLDDYKMHLIFSLTLKELNMLHNELLNIFIMVQINVQTDDVRSWIEHELSIYISEVSFLRLQKATRMLQHKWRCVYKVKSEAAVTIQKVWRASISNPDKKVCRNRLMWEYAQFTE